MAMQGGPGGPGPMGGGPLLMGMQQGMGGHPQMGQGQSPQGMGPLGGMPQQQGPGPLGMGPGGQGQPMQIHPGQQHMVHHPGQGPQGPPPPQMHMNPQDQPRMDNISRAKALMPNLQESLRTVLKMAGQAISANSMIDSGSKSVELDTSRFDKSLEEFFSVCDQIEMHLKTSIECIGQGMSSHRYLSTPVSSTKMDNSITYPQYISTVKGQIAYAKEVHDVLADATQKMTD